MRRCLPIFPYKFCIAFVCGLRLFSVNEYDKCGLADLSNICFDELPLIPHMIEWYAWEDAAIGSPRYCLDELPLMSHMIEWYAWWDAAGGSSRCCVPVVWCSTKAAVSVWLTKENSKGFKILHHLKMLPIWQIAHLSHYHRKKTVQKNVLFAFWQTLETNTRTL